MNETSSVSKGCFVFKSASRKRKRQGVDGYMGDGSDDNGKDRFRICQDLRETVQQHTEVLQDQLNKKVLDDLVQFIKKHELCNSSDVRRQGAREIPTAALMLGVNVPDHTMTFRSLCNLLQESVTPFVVSLHAKGCATVKFLIQRVLEQLMGRGMALDEEQDDETALHLNTQCSIGDLCQWYNSVKIRPHRILERSIKPEVKNNGLYWSLPIVVIFKDFEAFNLQALQDFILICSQYTQELPLIFIFGIATSPITIQHRLPHSVSSLLCIEVFHSLSCTQHLACVFDKLILTSKFPFKLSSRVIQVLIGIFLYHDFSVQSFVKGLQLSMLEHFNSQPLSVLCCKKQEALLRAKTLSQKNVERIRHLPSFMRYVETQEPQDQVLLLTSDEHVKEVCQKLLKNLHKYHKNYYPILQCLYSLTSLLPKCPMGKHIRELHVTCNEKNVWEMEEYHSAMQLLRILAKDELVAALRECAGILKSANTKKMQNVLKQVDEFVVRLEELDNLHTEDLPGDDVACSRKDIQRRTDLHYLQKSLLEKESRKTRKMSSFEILRNEVLQYIDELVREYLTPAELQPLSEVCYYSSSGVLRQRLNAAPRTSIQAALSHPFHYLQNEALKTNDGTVSSNAPDLCIIYKLHLECGRLINLYDWLEAFVTVSSATEDKEADSEEYNKPKNLKNACFIQAVSEMEFLGFVKSTKQKTDHVARLTWGGC
ncbi:Origin recognition complex subunit 3 [Triplophysa tibetana]|uniref:Origin recognition complex subunit 3 n=1 Tax=Triplophysa tibetana TaxID=1572043 RepID=A0A5A9NN44_9TELE|nr:Origin recognition complex subunit 3 [Triplophysa tibetana]